MGELFKKTTTLSPSTSHNFEKTLFTSFPTNLRRQVLLSPHAPLIHQTLNLEEFLFFHFVQHCWIFNFSIIFIVFLVVHCMDYSSEEAIYKLDWELIKTKKKMFMLEKNVGRQQWNCTSGFGGLERPPFWTLGRIEECNVLCFFFFLFHIWGSFFDFFSFIKVQGGNKNRKEKTIQMPSFLTKIIILRTAGVETLVSCV